MVKPEPGEITESGNIIENGDDDELHSQVNLICFWLRFGLANAINDFRLLKVKIRVVCVGNFQPLMLIN